MPARDVLLTDILPAGVRSALFRNQQSGIHTGGTPPVTCNLNTVGAFGNASVTIQVTAVAASGTPLMNVALVLAQADSRRPQFRDNNVTTVTAVN